MNATVKQCKCHGLSGTCSQHICWKAMPSRTEIGFKLKDMYEKSVRVKKNKNGKKLKAVDISDRDKVEHSLVYESKSVNFCERNLKKGSYGTSGRVCNATDHTSKFGCNIMCCNRGFYTRSRLAESSCNCSFTWCCKVECEKCLSGVTESFCR